MSTNHGAFALSYGSIVVKKNTMTKAAYKREHLIGGLAYSFREFIYPHHGGQNGDRQARMAPELTSNLEIAD